MSPKERRVLVGGALVLLLVAGGLAWRHRALKVARAPVADDESTPGWAELRSAGCDQITFLRAEDLPALVGPTGAHDEKVSVTCIGHGFSVPSCDAAASVYAHAPGVPAGAFVISVRKIDGKADRCIGRYDGDGKRLR